MTDNITESESGTNETEEVTEPVIHDKLITKNVWYFVFGEWSCLECGKKWNHKRTKIKLSKYKDGINADDLRDSERVGQECRKCSSKNSKLDKYTPLSSEDIKPPVHENLIVECKEDKWYRVFGTWDCGREDCDNKRWTSAHTYILLSKYMAEVPAADLICDSDYWGQDCTDGGFGGTLSEYRPLRRGNSRFKPKHKSTHCHKCPIVPCI
ncbi:hypothetical protein C1645_736474 [Glomus cerebriforme]|uniref:3CxxC-type domain-containing protein n=1 Tax=Glomus cerebriforme TaxID=658196 RepID=A0A397T1G8_9GLOM|nr:hypothetical protein C1645_736474 [Glomus cerebriforme]